jgi:formylglycine-generating enzyme required for sulfatase activity
VHDTEAASPTLTSGTLRLDAARRLSDHIFSQIRAEAWYDRPIPERNRLIFYLGHLEAFDWSQIGEPYEGPLHGALDRIFAFGIDPPPGRLPEDRPADWPSLEQVRGYANDVRRRLDAILDGATREALDIIIEHRLMHVETLTYLLHALPYERRVVQSVRARESRLSPEGRRIEIPAGPATLGLERGGPFGWDNEFDLHTVRVERFAVDRHKVTNGRYLAFVEEGGEPSPFWCRTPRGWCWRGFDALIPLPLDHPVYVTWEQASAFARWSGGSLPTEAQYHRYASGAPAHGSFDFLHRDTIPVDATPAGDSAFGVAQAVGNGWEWTASPFAPFPGFTPSPSYPGYSAPFFDGAHYVLKGASCATERTLVRRSFRNWFRPHYPHAYTAFRVVES